MQWQIRRKTHSGFGSETWVVRTQVRTPLVFNMLCQGTIERKLLLKSRNVYRRGWDGLPWFDHTCEDVKPRFASV